MTKLFKNSKTMELMPLAENMTYDGGDTVKAFLWDMSTIQPLAIVTE